VKVFNHCKALYCANRFRTHLRASAVAEHLSHCNMWIERRSD